MAFMCTTKLGGNQLTIELTACKRLRNRSPRIQEGCQFRAATQQTCSITWPDSHDRTDRQQTKASYWHPARAPQTLDGSTPGSACTPLRINRPDVHQAQSALRLELIRRRRAPFPADQMARPTGPRGGCSDQYRQDRRDSLRIESRGPRLAQAVVFDALQVERPQPSSDK